MDKFIETKHPKRTSILLALSTGILFGSSFPPSPLGVLACISLVPLLILIERLDSLRKQFLYSYFSFFIASCIALYWVGGFTHARDPFLMLAGGLVLVWEPLFYAIIVLSYVAVRRNFGLLAGLLALPFIWITWEWLYALGEFAFPWLTLGNTQTYQLGKIQFAEITGVYGISLWLVLINILFFLLLIWSVGEDGEKRLQRQIMLSVAILIVYVLPDVYDWTVVASRASSANAPTISVGIVQPNTDPWEKWDGTRTLTDRWRQVEKYLSVARIQKEAGAQISVWPETAVLYDIPLFRDDRAKVQQALDSLRMSLVTGYISYKYYEDAKAPVTSSVIRGSGLRYDSFNSIMYMEPGSTLVQSYKKMRLVPFAERIPYADAVPFLIQPLRWSVGISNWGIGPDSTVFQDTTHHTKFLAMVCYESIFPEFVSSFVKKGAEFLVFITNDSWWGNTSGARQHNQIAVLRAVENRRWVVRCANGGISCFIDPSGRMYDQTRMYTEASIVRDITPRNDQTFYTRHGDWLARGAAILSALFLVGSLVNFISFRMKKIG